MSEFLTDGAGDRLLPGDAVFPARKLSEIKVGERFVEYPGMPLREATTSAYIREAENGDKIWAVNVRTLTTSS